ncbi:MAG: HIT family protein [Candidatus Magasanikbacteria bacterium]|nr:HIT family protein [Candidatus Magasanikbacteria bacterium]
MPPADCLFCKIIAGEIPNYTVYEDTQVLAFLDINPCAKGHTVIVPKKHLATLIEMTETQWRATLEGVRQALRRVEAALQPDGFNIGINDRPAGGQVVPHVHWHIIPRWQGDGGGSIHSIIKGKDAGDVKETAKLFK